MTSSEHLPRTPSAERLIESAVLSITVALRNAKTLQDLMKHPENGDILETGPEFQFVAVNLQNATRTLVQFANAYQAERSASPILEPPTDGAA